MKELLPKTLSNRANFSHTERTCEERGFVLWLLNVPRLSKTIVDSPLLDPCHVAASICWRTVLGGFEREKRRNAHKIVWPNPMIWLLLRKNWNGFFSLTKLIIHVGGNARLVFLASIIEKYAWNNHRVINLWYDSIEKRSQSHRRHAF